jgi:hypothetical protein
MENELRFHRTPIQLLPQGVPRVRSTAVPYTVCSDKAGEPAAAQNLLE